MHFLGKIEQKSNYFFIFAGEKQSPFTNKPVIAP